MNRVGIITKMSKNYGAILQAYALKFLIEEQGNYVEIINYNGEFGNQTYKVFSRINSLGSIKYNVKRMMHALAIAESTTKFNLFRNRYFNLTKPYKDYFAVAKDPPNDEVYIVGSDQVWNPSILFSPIYFLAFGKESVIRASYAASFGKGSFPLNKMEDLKKYLANLNYISVREINGLEILKKVGYEGKIVLDPTLMLEKYKWRFISEKPKQVGEKPYILTYCLNCNETVIKYCKTLKRMTDLPIINICSNVWNPKIGDLELWNIGPTEFLWLFDHADYVITTSFHGTAFSVIFEKHFLTINTNSDDSRLKSVMQVLGETERVVDDYSDDAINLLVNRSVECSAALETYRKISLDFIRDIFSER